MSLDITKLKKIYKKHEKELLRDYFTFLRFKSIATDPAYKSDVIACAHWVRSYLDQIGFETELWEEGAQAPNIFATHLKGGKNAPTILLYNHYDVQPVDPIDKWDSPPFEPILKNGQVIARGASDNKGQCMYTLFALKILLKELPSLNLNLKYLIEGEEESGSSGLVHQLSHKKEKLKADTLLVIDSGFETIDQPVVALGARGIVTATVTVHGSTVDLHSGIHGGSAYNPNRALVEILASLHDENHRVTLPGFYESVSSLSENERSALDFTFDEKYTQKVFGMTPNGQEKGFNPKEASSIRPTLEINGITGGYGGEGFKTVIPATAKAKLSCRLVPNQDPLKIGQILKETIEKQAPKGCSVEVTIHPGIGRGFRTSPTSVVAQTVREVYQELTGKKCRSLLMGGSVPITYNLKEVSSAEPLLIGVSLIDDQIHAPNEHFGLNRLELGFLSMANLLQRLAQRSNGD